MKLDKLDKANSIRRRIMNIDSYISMLHSKCHGIKIWYGNNGGDYTERLDEDWHSKIFEEALLKEKERLEQEFDQL